VALLLGCGPSGHHGDRLRAEATILLADEPLGVNYLLSGGNRTTQDLIDRLFLHLFEEQPDFAEHPPTFAPRLAESWSWSSDHLTLSLALRPDVHWSDGVPLTAEDVRWTWQAQVDPAVAWPYADLKKHIRDVRITDPHHLEIEFSRRTPSMLAELNEGAILPRHAWDELPLAEWRGRADWFREHLVTAGPFVVESWESQQQVMLARNPGYYDPSLPRLDRVALRVVPLRQNRIAELEAGAADFSAQLTPAEAHRLTDLPDVGVRQFWHRQYDYLAWNLRRPPLDDVSVRRALTLSIDRPGLIAALWHNLARPATTAILTSTWAYDSALTPWPFDPPGARRAFAAAGWEADAHGQLRRDGDRLELEVLVNSGNSLHVDAAVLIQDQLRRAGVDVSIRRLDFHSLVRRLDAGDFDAALGSWGIDTSLDVGYAFHSRSITEGYNSGGYSSPQVDALIDSARVETALETRRRTLHEIQRLLHRDQPYTFLWEPPRFDAHSRRLRGVASNPLSSLYRLREWSIAAD